MLTDKVLIIVFGGSGYVGNHLSSKFSLDDKFCVIKMLRDESKSIIFSDLYDLNLEKFNKIIVINLIGIKRANKKSEYSDYIKSIQDILSFVKNLKNNYDNVFFISLGSINEYSRDNSNLYSKSKKKSRVMILDSNLCDFYFNTGFIYGNNSSMNKDLELYYDYVVKSYDLMYNFKFYAIHIDTFCILIKKFIEKLICADNSYEIFKEEIFFLNQEFNLHDLYRNVFNKDIKISRESNKIKKIIIFLKVFIKSKIFTRYRRLLFFHKLAYKHVFKVHNHYQEFGSIVCIKKSFEIYCEDEFQLYKYKGKFFVLGDGNCGNT